MGLFFNRKPPAPCLPNSFDRATGQFVIQFSSPATDGFYIHSGDLRQEAIATVTYLLGLQRCKPAPLLFVQSAKKNVHLMMLLPTRMILRMDTIWTLAFVYLSIHSVHPLFQ